MNKRVKPPTAAYRSALHRASSGRGAEACHSPHEQREARDALRTQRESFRALLDALPDQVVLTDADGKIRFLNRAAAAYLQELTGRPTGEVVGRHPAELNLPESVLRAIEADADEVNITRASVTREIALPLGGRGRWVELKSTPIVDGSHVIAHAVVGRDIDERKRATRRLELLSKVGALVGSIELEPVLSAVAQLSVPEFADYSIVDLRHESDMERVYIATRGSEQRDLAERLTKIEPTRPPTDAEDLAAGRTVYYPYFTDEDVCAHASTCEQLSLVQQIRICSLIAVPLRIGGTLDAVMSFVTSADSGRCFGADDVVLAEEIAHRASTLIENARLHEALKASEARFRVALGVSRTAVFEQDRELRYRWHYNPMLGRDPVGQRAADLFPPDEAQRLDALKIRAMETGRQATEEIQITFHGEQSCFAVIAEPTRDARGEITGVIGSATDITESKRAREELEQALGFRDRVMGILAHDLRNPLSAIVLAASTARRSGGLGEAVSQSIARIERAAKRMDEMIRTLLDFAQARFHGSIPIERVPADLADVARAIVDELHAARPDRVLELAVEGDTRGVWDPARLAEVLSNLASNALAHGAERAPVRIRVDGTGDDVIIRVHNDGPPIDDATRENLFEPFRRGENSAKGARGLGLGLFIVRQLVNAHRGTVTVESTEGDGTDFVVRIPRRA